MRPMVQSVRNGSAPRTGLKPVARPRKARKVRPVILIPHPHTGKRKLVLRCWYSLGDITLLTATLRELHRAHPGKFLTDVRTPYDDLWLHNPHVTPLREDEAEVIECNYTLLDESNTGPWHCIHSFTENLAIRLGIRIRPVLFKGDIHLHSLEKMWTPQVAGLVGADVP